MKSLATAAADYLAMRRALGYKLYHHTWWLPDFVRFVEAHDRRHITTDLALEWACQPADGKPNAWARRLSAVRLFATYMRASDPRTQVPPPDLLPLQSTPRLKPYLYRDDEIVALMERCDRLRGPLRRASYRTLLGLLAATGMRVGEALGLDDADVDLCEGLITIRHAKFNKSRRVPLDASVTAELARYRRERNRMCRHPRSKTFFVSNNGMRILHQNFHHAFLRFVRKLGLAPQRPRLHDLRHRFAILTLQDWYHSGVDVDTRLPWLSTYLGHVSPSSTYRYLTATPELVSLAASRLARNWTLAS